MSHELRTPLNAVIGFSEVLLERMFGDLNERQEDYLRDIRDAGRHLLALLNDVLDLSKVEAGQMELDPTTFDGPDAFQYALSLVRERAPNTSSPFPGAVDDLTSIRADELQVQPGPAQPPQQRGEVHRRRRLGDRVRRPDDGDLMVTVADTGIGIAHADQDRIFDSFQQGGRLSSGRGHRAGPDRDQADCRAPRRPYLGDERARPSAARSGSASRASPPASYPHRPRWRPLSRRPPARGGRHRGRRTLRPSSSPCTLPLRGCGPSWSATVPTVWRRCAP